ncbi:MAG: peptide ABC transporter substrate-binding protein [Symbiobacteriia bacterium]
MKRTLTLLFVVLMVFGIVAAGCGKSGATTAPEKKPMVLNWNLGEEPPSLDSVLTTDTVSFEIINATQEGLTRQQEGKPVEKGSGLAKDWTVSPDGLTYTFTLRDAKWSDGQPVTAKDFEYAWKRALNPKTAAEYSYQLMYLKGADALSSIDIKAADADTKIKAALDNVGVKAQDDKTLVVTLAAPTPYFTNLLSFITYMPQRQDIVEKYGDKYAAEADKMVYSGPYTIKDWTHESKMVLAKNPNYWDKDTVKIDTMNLVMIKDINTPVNMYEAGELDFIGVPPEFLAQYKSKGVVKTRADATTWYLQFNTRDAVFKNANIRKAFSLAVDRQEFVDKVLANGSVVATAYTPPTINGAGAYRGTLVPDLLKPTADPEAAKAALAAGLKELGLTKLPKIAFLSGDNERAKKWAVAIQEMFKKNLGIEVNVETVAFKVRLDRMTKGQYQIVFAGWGADYNDPMTFIDMWVTTPVDNPGNNSAFYSNPAYDKDVQTAKSSGDNAVRLPAMADAEKILMNELPIAPIFHPAWNFIEKPYVKGIQRFATGSDLEFKWASVDAH